MLTKNEISALSLSPTKKDFVQIWNELLDVAGKLSDRWDPTSTNESDPGIVILKALAGIADKLNYNIDKNTLEAFMPTAAQEDSMRKLCEMLGYNIKYYQSATTKVTFKYYNTDPTEEELSAIAGGLVIPKFTVVNTTDQDKSYFTIEHLPILITAAQPSVSIECMEGQIVKCKSINDNDVISINQISEDNRFYLPETQIAENGIFIYNICYTTSGVSDDGEPWTKVDNLNTQSRGTKVFKFGFDSYEGRPYIEFPDDYSMLFNDGIFIYYARTSGVNGNTSTHTLTQVELPNTSGWDKIAPESFSADNAYAATSGANIETIKQAYNNFKKTIGTFNTLVTCRDYMNKIYNMVDSFGSPLVSNVLVTDIRNDLNSAITICSCDDAGILFKEKPLMQDTETSIVTASGEATISYPTKPVFNTNTNTWHLGDINGVALGNNIINRDISKNAENFNPSADGTVIQRPTNDYWIIQQDGAEFITNIKCRSTITTAEQKPKINYFDLVLYPFKSYKQIKSDVTNVRAMYDDSFNFTNLAIFDNIAKDSGLKTVKTIAHNIVKPENKSIVSINNYLKLNATIATTSKLTVDEGNKVIKNIKIALANAFNMRELDFGEEIPFESIMEVIEKADTRIKIVSLNTPELYTTFSVLERFTRTGVPEIVEYAVASKWLSEEDASKIDKFTRKDENGYIQSSFDTKEARQLYNKLAVRNILAGRLPLFKYNTTFTSDFSEAPYQTISTINMTSLNTLPAGLIEQPLPENIADTYNIWMDADGNIYTLQGTTDSLGANGYICSKIQTPYTTSGSATGDDSTNSNTSTGSQNGASGSNGSVGTDNTTNNNGSNNVVLENVDGSPLTDLSTYSNIYTNENGIITDVTLSDGEYVKFRSPNFRTIKTYPAYVNYHLKLNQETDTDGQAKPAVASTLFDILDTSDSNKQKVLDYFTGIDNDTGTSFVKKFTISQEISAFSQASATDEDLCTGVNNAGRAHVRDDITGTCKYCDKEMFATVQKGPIKVVIKDENAAKLDDVDAFLRKSGFIKLLNTDFKARLEWSPAEGQSAPKGEVPLTIQLEFDTDYKSQFITDSAVVARIQSTVTNMIEQSRNNVKSEDDPTPILPTDCAWTVCFDFECVPFEQESLLEWEKFIKFYSSSTQNSNDSLLTFKPVEESGVLFWRTYGQGYEIGKYVLSNHEKLLKFDRNYFSTVDNLASGSVLHNIYLVEYLGADIVPNLITNNTDYQLKDNEYLYLEYTPSSTTEDGTQQSQPPKQEILGPGTIIRPSGFTTGLIDSDVYGYMGNTAHKEVTFEQKGQNIVLPVYRFAANEQVEVRELARVELSQDTIVVSANSSRTIYLYKNFDCPELESFVGATLSARTYTLKDGEYIFYTDSNKAEFAYFGSGTEVILEGNAKIPKCDIVDIATILESGVSDSLWQSIALGAADKVIFQEFQYVTLGPDDTVEVITFDANTVLNETEDGNKILNDEWKYCDSVVYKLSGAETSTTLPTIDVKREGTTQKGNGWEACSFLAINTSPTNAQTLRYEEGVIDTGIILTSADSEGNGKNTIIISPKNTANSSTSASLSVKTNVYCTTGSNHASITDLVNTRTGITGFQVKVYTTASPIIVETRENKVVPISSKTSLLEWTGSALQQKNAADTWHQTNLDAIRVARQKEEDGKNITYDNALVLPVLLTPNTYGIATFYINYTNVDTGFENKTWIETIPGMSKKDLQILNVSENTWETAGASSDKSNKLFLNPGINCVVFNKSGKFFIKASSTAQGILYFDDLKLVNRDILCYTNTDDNTTGSTETKIKKIFTNGLNLDQIGYLSTTNAADSQVLDQETLKALASSLCDSVKIDLESLASEAQNSFLQKAEPLIEALPTVNSLKDELDHIMQDIGKDEYNTIIATYNNINSTLKLESDLLEAIMNNTADEQLLSYISQLAPKEITQAQLTSSLEYIKLLIEEKIKARTTEQTLDSFVQNFNKNNVFALHTESQAALLETKELLIQKANDAFITELENFVSKLENILNGDELTNLRVALDTLQEAFIKEKNANIQALLNKLITSASLTEVYSLLEEITTANSSQNYSRVTTLLTNLKNLITSKESQVVLSELTKAVSEQNIITAKSLLASLRELDEPDSFVQKIVTKIEVALSSVQDYYDIVAKIEEEKKNSSDDPLAGEGGSISDVLGDAANVVTLATYRGLISVALSEVKTSINDEYKGRLSTLVEEIDTQLDAATTDKEILDLQDFINSIAATNDTRLTEALDNIKSTKSTYDAYKTALKLLSVNTSWSDINTAVYAEDFKAELIAVWHNTLLAAVKHRLASLETAITAAILVEDVTELLSSTPNNGMTILELREAVDSYFNRFIDIDKAVLARDQLDILVNAIETMCLTQQKNSAITLAAESLSDIFGVSKAFSTAEESKFAALVGTAKDRIQPIIELLTDLNTQSLTQTQKTALLANLKTELQTAKALDTQLLNLIENYLYPNAIRVQKIFNTDSFEYAMAKKLMTAVIVGEDNIDKDTYFDTEVDDYYTSDKEYVPGMIQIKNCFIYAKAILDYLESLDISNYDVIELYSKLTAHEYDLKFILKDKYEELSDIYQSLLLLKQSYSVNMAEFFEYSDVSEQIKTIESLLSNNELLKTETDLTSLLASLKTELQRLLNASIKVLTDESSTSLATIALESQLLQEILATDINRDFYYTATIDDSVAIDFGAVPEGTKTLLNPALNYDINNANNSFVISKLDIDYLDSGINIARSSRISY